MTAPTKRFVVDRREGRIIVVVGDDDVSYDVSSSHLPPDCRAEGAVFDAPVGNNGKPSWKQAKRNSEEEGKRITEANERLDRLRRRDPGGDISL